MSSTALPYYFLKWTTLLQTITALSSFLVCSLISFPLCLPLSPSLSFYAIFPLLSHLLCLSLRPQCQQYKERTSVLENQPAGTFVVQVHAVDADEGANGKVTYGFMHRDSTIPAFNIDPDTGTPSARTRCKQIAIPLQAATVVCHRQHQADYSFSNVDSLICRYSFRFGDVVE